MAGTLGIQLFLQELNDLIQGLVDFHDYLEDLAQAHQQLLVTL